MLILTIASLECSNPCLIQARAILQDLTHLVAAGVRHDHIGCELACSRLVQVGAGGTMERSPYPVVRMTSGSNSAPKTDWRKKRTQRRTGLYPRRRP